MTSPGRTETDCKGEPPCGVCRDCRDYANSKRKTPLCEACLDEDQETVGACCISHDIAAQRKAAPPQVPESEPGESEGEPPAWITQFVFGYHNDWSRKRRREYVRLIHAAFLASDEGKRAKAALYCSTTHCDCDQANIARAALARPESETREERKG